MEKFLQLNMRLFQLLEHWLHMDNWAPLGPRQKETKIVEDEAKNKHSKEDFMIKKKQKEPARMCQVNNVGDKCTRKRKSNT